MKRSGVASAVKAELTASAKQNSALGRTAMVLALRIDDFETPATAVAAMAKELRSALTELGLEARVAANPLDELKKRRLERQKAGGVH
jgi:hypothetical protein